MAAPGTSSGNLVATASDSPLLDDVAASFRVLAESLARMEVAEMEMTRARESLRWEAEKRRMEVENDLTRMLLGAHLHIASIVEGKVPSRKRKPTEHEDESPISARQRTGALLLSLLHRNFSL